MAKRKKAFRIYVIDNHTGCAYLVDESDAILVTVEEGKTVRSVQYINRDAIDSKKMESFIESAKRNIPVMDASRKKKSK